MNDSINFLTESDISKLAKNPIVQEYLTETVKEERAEKSSTWNKVFDRLSKNNKLVDKLSRKRVEIH